MQEQSKNNQQDAQSKHEDFYVDDKTQEKIDKHQTDIDDKISEEDIQNANTNITSGDSVINNTKQTDDIIEDKNENSGDDKQEDKDEPNQQIPTAFNILGS